MACMAFNFIPRSFYLQPLFRILATIIPSRVRHLQSNLITISQTMSVKKLHFVARSVHFGKKKTFTSWIVEAIGAVPIQRRKDFTEGMANNDASMAILTQVRGPRVVNHSEI